MPLRLLALVNSYASLLDPLRASGAHPVVSGPREVVRIVRRVHRPENARREIIPGQSGDEETLMQPVQTSLSRCSSLKQPPEQRNVFRKYSEGRRLLRTEIRRPSLSRRMRWRASSSDEVD
jgi:hypothetical protein